MVSHAWVSVLLKALKTGLGILKPRDKEIITYYKERPVELKNVLSKGTKINLIIIYGGKNIYLTGEKIEDIPQEIIDTLKKQHSAPIGQLPENIPRINIFSINEYELFKEYEAFFKDFHDPILSRAFPYLKDEFITIFVLSSFIQKLIENGERKKAETVKRSIENRGEKEKSLCNLCLHGFIKNKFEESLDNVFFESQDFNMRKLKINGLIEELLEDEDKCILFICDEGPKEVAESAFSKLKNNVPHVKIFMDHFIDGDSLKANLLKELNILNELHNNDYKIIFNEKGDSQGNFLIEKP